MGCGVKGTLRGDSHVEVLAWDVAGVELETVIVRDAPKVVILGEGVEYALLASLRAKRPTLGIIVLAHDPSPLFETLLLAAGATCLAHRVSGAELIAAVHLAASGARMSVTAPTGRVVDVDPAAGLLTVRETQVFEYLSLGWSYHEVGHALHIAPTTVRTHTVNICRKLNVRSKRQLIGRRWLPAAAPCPHGQE